MRRNGYSAREADDIANLAFIGGKTNQSIKDKAPSEYFPPLIKKLGKAAFTAQSIPVTESLLELDNYKTFLAERRALIAQRLNAFIDERA